MIAIHTAPEPAPARICAIHQPNFFPWLGYFDKIRRSDVFVFLDAVAYPKSGNSMGSWCNRVRIDVQGKPRWAACAVRREHGEQKISDVMIDDDRPWRHNLLRTLALNYRRSPNFERAMATLEPLVLHAEARLAEFNIYTVRKLSDILGVDAKFCRQSELPARGRATDLLIAITRAVKCDAYLCGGGAEGYQQDTQFSHQGIRLLHENFQTDPYRVPDRFIPGLSVIDYLMHAPAGRMRWQ